MNYLIVIDSPKALLSPQISSTFRHHEEYTHTETMDKDLTKLEENDIL